MESSLDVLSTLQTKVLCLEHSIDKIAENFTLSNHANIDDSKHLKCNMSGNYSPHLSTCPPRPSVDSSNRKSSASAMSRDVGWMSQYE